MGNSKSLPVSACEHGPDAGLLRSMTCMSLPSARTPCCSSSKVETEGGHIVSVAVPSRGRQTDLGCFEVVASELAVVVAPGSQGTPVCFLTCGTVVEVVETSVHGDPLILWGRIVTPSGWISLRQADADWHCCAAPLPESSASQEPSSNPNADAVDWVKLEHVRGCIKTGASKEPMQERPPQMLHLRTPNGQHSCAGIYHLFIEETPNGHPCWSRQDKSRWLYSSGSGRWCIGGGDVRSEQFNRTAGFISSVDAHGGRMPHEHLAWQRWDGYAFVRDNDIKISSWEVPLKQGARDRVPDEDVVDQCISQQVISGLQNNTAAATTQALVHVKGSTVDNQVSEQPPSDVQGEASSSGRLDTSVAAAAAAAAAAVPAVGLAYPELPPASLVQQQRQPEQLEQLQLPQQPHCGTMDSLTKVMGTEQQQLPPQEVISTPELDVASDASSTCSTSISRTASACNSADMKLSASQMVLRVVTQKQPSCEGFYDLVLGMRPNGKPLWRMRGGSRWIYMGTDGRWYVGGTMSKRLEFKCESGYMFHSAQGCSLPGMLQGPWSWGDSKTWHEDPAIEVRQVTESELVDVP